MPIASSLLKKPRLVKKLKDFYTYVQKNDGKVGTKTRGIDLNFNNACNLRCKYCFTNSPKGDHVKEYLDYKAIAKGVIKFVEESSFQLQETLAEGIAALVKEEYGVESIKLRVSKPGAISGSKDVGLIIHR